MRFLILSDIHANFPALQAVLQDSQKRDYGQVLFLGDAVGYGPHPREVLAVLRDLQAQCVRGNHDVLMLSAVDGASLPQDGRVHSAILWQQTQLRDEDIDLLRSWPDGLEVEGLNGLLRHGSPLHQDEYVDSLADAREVFSRWDGKLALVGHTHIAGVYATLNAPVGEWVKFQDFRQGGQYLVPPSARVILNPGSVGQPRDGNPQASYGVYDSARRLFEVFRVEYDIAKTQHDIRAAGLPEMLASRLSFGQ